MSTTNAPQCNECHHALERTSLWTCPTCKTYLQQPNDSMVSPVQPAEAFAHLKAEIRILRQQIEQEQKQHKWELDQVQQQLVAARTIQSHLEDPKVQSAVRRQQLKKERREKAKVPQNPVLNSL